MALGTRIDDVSAAEALVAPHADGPTSCAEASRQVAPTIVAMRNEFMEESLAEPGMKVLHIWIWGLEFVSNFGFRVSDFPCRHRHFAGDVNTARA
jgi:hypothetical protein